MTKTTNYRGIVQVNQGGKLLYSWTARKVEDHAYSKMQPTQCGAVRNRGTDIAALQIREFVTTGVKAQQSTAAMFIDVIGAFDNVCRETLLSPGGALDLLQIPKDLQAQTRAAHRQTCLVSEGLEGTLLTPKGVRRRGSIWIIDVQCAYDDLTS